MVQPFFWVFALVRAHVHYLVVDVNWGLSLTLMAARPLGGRVMFRLERLGFPVLRIRRVFGLLHVITVTTLLPRMHDSAHGFLV